MITRRSALYAILLTTLGLLPAACDRVPKDDNGFQERGKDRVESAPIRTEKGRISRTAAEGVEGEWWLPNLDYANSRFSNLAQITTANVAQLKIVNSMATGINRGHEGNPLVVKNTMYVVTPYPNVLLAIDLTVPGGKLKWKYNPEPDIRAMGVACCDVVNRGASYADGKIVYNALDAHTVAVDAETGKELWKTKVGDINMGETTTMAPLIVKNTVIVGNSGGELGVRGWVKGLDLGTGKVKWTAYNTGPDDEVLIGPDFKAYYPKDQGSNLGVTSWPPQAYHQGGATVWGWISYDPELDLIYYGTGNPGPWNPAMRPGDNKWSTSVIARDPDDGKAKWAFQFFPHDEHDYDEIMENVLVDLPIGGRMRKVLIHPGRSGFVFVLDRTNGQLLSAEKFQYANWAEHYDLKTGEAKLNPAKQIRSGSQTREICPSSTGAKEFVPTSFSPRTGLLYIPSMHVCMNETPTEVNYIAGTPYVGMEVMMYPGPYGPRGELVAWDPVAARRIWAVPEHFPVYSGVLSTAGDLVFYGTMDGWFKALDARTGTELWKVKLASGIVGNPMTYTGPDGRQYVAVYAGIGGWMGAVAFPDVSISDPTTALGVAGAVSDIKMATAPAGLLYVFAL